jgi:hypothetical protein
MVSVLNGGKTMQKDGECIDWRSIEREKFGSLSDDEKWQLLEDARGSMKSLEDDIVYG